MSNDAIRAKLIELVDFMLSEPAEIDLGDVYAYVKYDLGIGDDREVKRLILEAVREMLRRGVRADFDDGVPSMQHHPGKTPDEVIARIDREWDALGKLPAIFGEICIFEWTPSSMDTYARKQSMRWTFVKNCTRQVKKKGGPGTRRDPPDLSPSRISMEFRSLP